MKKNMFLVFIIMFFCLLISYANADCTKTEINLLKKDAEKIRVFYKHLGAIDSGDEFVVYDRFDITFKNVDDDFYIEENSLAYKNSPKNGVITDTFVTGTWNFNIVSTKCNTKIHSIKVVLPKFNVYSLDPLCEDIDGDDFVLCSKYYSGNVSYDYFKNKVLEYKSAYKRDSEEIDNENSSYKYNISYYLKNMYDFIIKNGIYFFFGFVFIVIAIVVLVIHIKRSKRGVLK